MLIVSYKKEESISIQWVNHFLFISHIYTGVLLFVRVDALCTTQQFFSLVRTFSCLFGLNQYQAEDKVSCSRTQHSDSGES